MHITYRRAYEDSRDALDFMHAMVITGKLFNLTTLPCNLVTLHSGRFDEKQLC